MEKRVCKAKFSTSHLPSRSPHQAGLHIASVLRARSPQKLQRAWLCEYMALEWPKSACCCDPKVVVYAQSFRDKGVEWPYGTRSTGNARTTNRRLFLVFS